MQKANKFVLLLCIIKPLLSDTKFWVLYKYLNLGIRKCLVWGIINLYGTKSVAGKVPYAVGKLVLPVTHVTIFSKVFL